MKIIDATKLTKDLLEEITTRSGLDNSSSRETAEAIISEVKRDGLEAVIQYAQKFDGYKRGNIRLSDAEIADALTELDTRSKNAINHAFKNILAFHKPQKPVDYTVETQEGVFCERRFIPIENVGLYIPGGSAVLPSTVLMLGVPAMIAGCKRIVLVTPASEKIEPAVIYAATLCGISEIYAIGGAQAIAMLAYGVKGVEKVDKIFGPGNQFVTAAKMVVSTDGLGCMIDMPTGPSELLIIADDTANPGFVASDLLSQAEHGVDSQTILLSTSQKVINEVEKELVKQISLLSRKKEIEGCLLNSKLVLVANIEDAFTISNKYAPEHLIINTENARLLKGKVINAGSVFIGQWSPESAGDYASGTNHSLPTSGYARATGGVAVESFMKGITFQELSRGGLEGLADTIITLAKIEKLDAHASAVKQRILQ
ncbi:MAG: histidinol dehydrogenase [Ignavibacteriales bacterium]|nr:histidinol dehydrogenase [Ignavibacteriales bacterium]